MEPRILQLFQQEIARQCKFAIFAFQDLEQALQSRDKDIDRIWYSVQALLVAVGNISKLLWPTNSNQKLKERGKSLREILGVTEDSPLESRAIRNDFEHFDERLQKWASSSKRRNLVDSNIGNISGIRGIDPEDYLRNLNPSTWELTFQGKAHNLKTIIEAVKELNSLAQKIHSLQHPFTGL